MIISHEHKYVFIEIPKNASTSIKKLLKEHCAGFSDGYSHNVKVPKNCEDYFFFCVVRNPYSRYLSFYNFIQKVGHHRCHEVSKKLNIKDFARWWTDYTIEPTDIFRDPNQVNFLSVLPFKPHIVRFENLFEDLKQIEFIGSKACYLDHLNVGDCLDWKTVYDSELEAIVYEWAKEDFESFNYQRLTF